MNLSRVTDYPKSLHGFPHSLAEIVPKIRPQSLPSINYFYLILNSTLTVLIAGEYFNTFIHSEGFKFNICITLKYP
jgi:hypothetical protein